MASDRAGFMEGIVGCSVARFQLPVIANDLEGLIESVDAEAGTFEVQGIAFVTGATPMKMA